MLNLLFNFKFKQNQTKLDCNNHTRILCTCFAINFAVLLLVSCASDNAEYNFKNCNEAIDVYRKFHVELKGKPHMDSDELRESLCKWKKLTDTLYKYMENDTSQQVLECMSTYFSLHDSIQTEMYRLAASEERTLKDAFDIRYASALEDKKELENEIHYATQFFSSLDGNKVLSVDRSKAISLYKTFLDDVDATGIYNDRQLEEVLRREDVLFRTLMKHLDDLETVPLSEITDLTKMMCKSIYINASEGKLDCKRTLVIMSMRTNRRLIQNSKTCVESIKGRYKLSEIQRNAYFFMIVQPYIAIDPFGMTILSDNQVKELREMASAIQDLENRNKLNPGKSELKDITNLILKLQISSI